MVFQIQLGNSQKDRGFLVIESREGPLIFNSKKSPEQRTMARSTLISHSILNSSVIHCIQSAGKSLH